MRLITFGVFDLLHVGHIHMLKQASEFGKVIAIAADDASIREFKGAGGRPITPIAERLEMLRALKYVSEAGTFSFTMQNIREAHEQVIKEVAPDMFVQGEQANHEYIYPVLKRLEIPILTVPSISTSTTGIINKIRGSHHESYFPDSSETEIL